MGQRHQVYVFVKDKKGEPIGAGLYHQWLYGRTAGLQAVRMMEYFKEAKKENYHPLTGGVNTYGLPILNKFLENFYSTIQETGYHSTEGSAIDTANGWEDGVRDPRIIDNNDGVTVFDFTDPKNPTYCMMNIHAQDGDRDSASLPKWTPVSAERYIRAYYPIGGTAYQKEHWKPKQFRENEKQLAKIFKRVPAHKLMTKERVRELFPVVFAKKPKVKVVKKINDLRAANLLRAAANRRYGR